MTAQQEIAMNLGWNTELDSSGDVIVSHNDCDGDDFHDINYCAEMDAIDEFNDMLCELTDKFGADNVKMLNTQHGVHNVYDELPF
jgi:hypothetical protein